MTIPSVDNRNNMNVLMKNPENQLFKILDFILIFTGLGILFFIYPHSIYGDGSARFIALSKLLNEGNISGAPYSMVGPIFSAILYALGKFYKSPEWWCSRFNFFIFALGLLLIYRILVNNVNSSFLRKFILILILGSMFTFHQRAYYGEVFTAVFVSVGILGISYRNPFLGWTSILLGVVNTPASVVGLGFVVLVIMLKNRKLRFIMILAFAIVLILAESWIRRGSLFITGYGEGGGFPTIMPFSGRAGFSYPMFFGLISILFSFGKGIFWFAPGLLLPIKKEMSIITEKLYECYYLWIYFLIGLILVYSNWWAWYGGWFWGPRFFLLASIPASFAVAANLSRESRSSVLNLFLLAVLSWSFWVGINGLIFVQRNLEICTNNNYALELLCWYVPEFSVLFRPFVVSGVLDTKDIIIIIFITTVFFYLAIPVLLQLMKSITRKGKELKSRYLEIEKWRV